MAYRVLVPSDEGKVMQGNGWYRRQVYNTYTIVDTEEEAIHLVEELYYGMKPPSVHERIPCYIDKEDTRAYENMISIPNLVPYLIF